MATSNSPALFFNMCCAAALTLVLASRLAQYKPPLSVFCLSHFLLQFLCLTLSLTFTCLLLAASPKSLVPSRAPRHDAHPQSICPGSVSTMTGLFSIALRPGRSCWWRRRRSSLSRNAPRPGSVLQTVWRGVGSGERGQVSTGLMRVSGKCEDYSMFPGLVAIARRSRTVSVCSYGARWNHRRRCRASLTEFITREARRVTSGTRREAECRSCKRIARGGHATGHHGLCLRAG